MRIITFFLILVLILSGCWKKDEPRQEQENRAESKNENTSESSSDEIPRFENDNYIYFRLSLENEIFNPAVFDAESFASCQDTMFFLLRDSRCIVYTKEAESFKKDGTITLDAHFIDTWNNSLMAVGKNSIIEYSSKKPEALYEGENALSHYDLTVDWYDSIFVWAEGSKNMLYKFDNRGRKTGSFAAERIGSVYSDSRGLVYIVCENPSAVYVYNISGQLLRKIPVESKKFSISLSENCMLAICETEKNRVNLYTSQFELKKQFGTLGTSAGEFVIPTDIKQQYGKIYVCEYGGNRVQIFDDEGKYIREIPLLSSDIRLKKPVNVFLDEKQNVFILDCEGEELKIFGSDGVFVKKFQKISRTESRFSVFADESDRIYLVDSHASRLKVMGVFPVSLKVISNLIYKGGEQQVISNPVFNSEGKIFFMTAPGILHGVDGNREFSQKLEGLSDSRPEYSVYKAFSNNDILYIVDRDNNRIVKFLKNQTDQIIIGLNRDVNRDGKFDAGQKAGEFNMPSHMCFAQDGSFYVADTKNNRIQKFSSDGHPEKIYSFKISPLFCGVDSQYVYAADDEFIHVASHSGEMVCIAKIAGQIKDMQTTNDSVLVLFRAFSGDCNVVSARCIMPYSAGKEAMYAGNMNDAIKYFEMVDPDKYLNPYLYFYLQYCYNQIGDSARAQENLEKARKITERFSDVQKLIK